MADSNERQARALTFLQVYVVQSLLNLEESHIYGVYKEVTILNTLVPIAESVNVPSVYKSVKSLSKNGLVQYREGDNEPGSYPARGMTYSVSDQGRRVMEEYSILLNKIQQLLA